MDYKRITILDENNDLLVTIAIPSVDWRDDIHSAQAHEALVVHKKESSLTETQRKIVEDVARIRCDIPCKDIERVLQEKGYIKTK